MGGERQPGKGRGSMKKRFPKQNQIFKKYMGTHLLSKNSKKKSRELFYKKWKEKKCLKVKPLNKKIKRIILQNQLFKKIKICTFLKIPKKIKRILQKWKGKMCLKAESLII